jgi:hypothetical protein
MSSWNDAKAMASSRSNAQNGLFIRLQNNGDKVVGVFVGEPLAKDVLWTGERYETFDDKNPAHVGKRPSFRVSVNFWDTVERRMKVIEGGIAWFKDVLKVREKYGLDDWSFEIERHGDSGDPKTTYSILPDQRLTAEQKQEIARVKLNDLNNPGGGEAKDSFDSYDRSKKPAGSASASEDVVASITAELKKLPRGAVDEFLGRFGITRVKDLRPADFAAARELAERLVRQHAAPAPENDDPFA